MITGGSGGRLRLPLFFYCDGGGLLTPNVKNDPADVSRDPQYREPPYEDLSSLVAGRIQAGPQSTPPREGTDLDHWQDPDLFHSPEL